MSLVTTLAELDGSENYLEVHTVEHVLTRQLREKTIEDSSEARAEVAAFGFSSSDERSADWGTYFGPQLVFQDADGAKIEVPSLAGLDQATIDHWKQRAQAAQHPTMKARYADLVWDLEKKLTGNKPSHTYAQVAIDAYVSASQLPGLEFAVQGYNDLSRALSLALGLNDRARVEQVRDVLIAFEAQHGQDDHHGTWGWSFDLILQNRNVPRSEDQERDIIQALEGRLRRMASPGGASFDPHGADAAAKRLASYYRGKDQPDDMARVLLSAGAAFQDAAQRASPLLGAAWMEDVRQGYEQFGLHEEARKLDPILAELGRRSHGDLKTISYDREIPAKDVKAFLDALLGDTLDATLERIAAHFIENREEVESEVKRHAKEGFLQSLFTLKLQDAEGRTEASVGSVEHDLGGRVIHHMAERLQFKAFWLRRALEETAKRFQPTDASLLAFCRLSPAFEEHDYDLLRRAFAAYLADDHSVACHLLVPRIEQAFRRLVILQGKPHLRPGRTPNGGLQLRMLHELIADSEPVFGGKLIPYLHVLLTDQRGWNLRNSIAHGYVAGDSFGPMMTDRLLHVILLLGSVRKTKQQREQPGPATSADHE